MTSPEASQFSTFLLDKGALLYAAHEDFLQMPSAKIQEIMTTFSECSEISVTTTRSFPHQWSFHGNVGGEEIILNWTGPDLNL